jgi:hypothetical protein
LTYRKVSGVVIYSRLFGRWSHGSTVVTAQTLLRASEVELAPNGNPADLDIAFRYQGESLLYASTDENIHWTPTDLRYHELPSPCTVEVEVTAANAKPTSEWFDLLVSDDQLRLVHIVKPHWYMRNQRRAFNERRRQER